ncbi:MAG: 16S rRNA (uracil(1498)-N(3))-methyltransferase [Pirellulales bacterium]
MADRYFFDRPITASHATLDGPEAHHLIHVMRIRPGDQIIVFDGSGSEFAATVSRLDRRTVALDIGPRREVDRELPASVEIGVALPKGDRGRWLVEKLTELGVTRIVPLTTVRSVVRVDEKSLGRLRRGVVEASKQCGRNRLLEITSPQPWQSYVESAAAPWRLVAHLAPSGTSPLAISVSAGAELAIAIGPEGGLVDEEAEAAVAAGWRIVGLGPRILRVETAAVALAAWAADQVMTAADARSQPDRPA